MATQSLKEQSPGQFNLIVTKLQTFLAEDEIDNILTFALSLGFKPEWLVVKKSNKKQTPGPP